MKHTLYAICGLGLLCCSCQKEQTVTPPHADRSIFLRATVENMKQTRAPFVLSEPQRENPLIAAVWASTTEHVFEDLNENGTGGSEVALHTQAKFTSGTEQLLADAVYPKKDGTVVYFVGLHPAADAAGAAVWETPATGDRAGKTATMTFSGFEDVMFAPQIEGQYAENLEAATWPTFVFHHLLTWLRVRVKAYDEAVSEAWGKLKSLKIRSKYTVEVDLNKAYDKDNPPENMAGYVSFPDAADGTDGTKEFDFYKKGTDGVFVKKDVASTWYKLPYTEAEEVAYVLCAPVEATEREPDEAEVKRTTEYTLLVETENRTVEVPVDLKVPATDPAKDPSYFTGSTMSRQFILNLTFKMGNNITVAAAVTDWVIGGLGDGVLDPNVSDETDETGDPDDPATSDN